MCESKKDECMWLFFLTCIVCVLGIILSNKYEKQVWDFLGGDIGGAVLIIKSYT